MFQQAGKNPGVTELIFEISRIVFRAYFLRTFDDFVHFWEKPEIKQTSNVKLFFKRREDVQTDESRRTDQKKFGVTKLFQKFSIKAKKNKAKHWSNRTNC